MVRRGVTPNADVRSGAQPRTDARSGSGAEVEVKAKENLKPKQAHGEAVPDWVPAESWTGFVEMRKRSRKPFTSRAVQLIVQKLEKLRANGESVAEILDQSTRNEWQDVFPLKQ